MTNPKYKWAVLALSALLLLSLAYNLFWHLRTLSKKSWQSHYTLLSPDLRITDKRNSKTSIGVISFTPLRTQIESYIDQTIGPVRDTDLARRPLVGVYIEDLNTGEWIGFRERYKFLPFSLIKVPMAVAAMRKVDKGEWTLDQKFDITEGDLDTRPEVFQWDSTTKLKQITLAVAIEKLLGESDNNLYHVFRRNLTDPEIEDVLYHLGFVYPEDPATPAMSPKNYATIFRSLYYSTYLSLESAQHLLDIMSRSIHVYTLRSAIPADIPVAHKIGMYYPTNPLPGKSRTFLHEAGIVYYPKDPFLIVIMTSQMDHVDAANLIREIARMVYAYYEEQTPPDKKS